MPGSTSDAALLQDFRVRRDEVAFRALYRRHTAALYALAMRLTGGSASDAEELVQESWYRAVQGLDGFEGRAALRTWLCGIVVNCHRELLRRASRAPLPLEVDGETRPDAEPPISSRPRRNAEPIDVERAIARLADGYREVLVLHDLNGYTHREIAELLGIEEGTSKSQLARGRARLRALLRAESPAAEESERGRR